MDYPLPSLCLGVTQCIYSGHPAYTRPGFNIWNLFSKYKITFTFLATTYVDQLDRKGVVPGTTEAFGDFTGFDFNLPSYNTECQVPALGVEIKCFDPKGVWCQNDEGWINPETGGLIVIGRT
ncbi:acetoacetyl-CoA synthetase [Trichonephila clavata]|uniref:Acetoacetyl-CoA synthetase n=1 Tax=Trichonephila clavata TaxID=2740835 RepID=A0A8X6J8A0_TRICU|nr:acetoacetyl-CoA synthetase [Trichonephila clavata]